MVLKYISLLLHLIFNTLILHANANTQDISSFPSDQIDALTSNEMKLN
jgi:hypothetical protein